MRRTNRQVLAVLFGTATGLIACDRNPTEPDPDTQLVTASLEVRSTVPPGTREILNVTGARVRLTRNSTGEFLDTAVTVTYSGDTITYLAVARIPAGGVRGNARVILVNGSERPVFEAAETSLHLVPGPNPARINDLNYVGVGSEATSVTIVDAPDRMFFGDSAATTTAVRNSSGAAIEGVPTYWSSTSAELLSIDDPAAGDAVAGVRRGLAGIVATLYTGQADTAFVEVQPRPTQLAVTSGGNQTGTVATALANDVTMRLVAADGLPVALVDIAFQASDSGSITDTLRTDASGSVALSWTLGTRAGIQTLTASVPGTGLETIVSAEASPGTPSVVTLADGDAQVATVGTPVALSPTVSVTDLYGNPVTGVQVAFRVSAGNGSLSDTLGTTDSLGIAIAGVWTLGSTAGTNTVTATVRGPLGSRTGREGPQRRNGKPLARADLLTPIVFTATGMPGQAYAIAPTSASEISGRPQTALNDSLVVVVTDSLGNRVGETPVLWDASGGSLSQDTVTSDSSGIARNVFTPGSFTGIDTVTAGLPSGTTTEFFVTVLPGTASGLSFLSQPASSFAGDRFTVTVGVFDEFGNLSTTDSTTMVSIGLAGGTPIIGTDTARVIGGVATFESFTLGDVGTQFLVATAAGLKSDTSARFDVTAALATRVAFTTQPSDIPAGSTFSPAPAVTVFDGLNNVVPTDSVRITLRLSNGGQLIGTATSVTTMGAAVFGELSPGTTGTDVRLIAEAAGLTPDTSAVFVVSPGNPSRLAFVGSPASFVAGSRIPTPIQVLITDSLRNTVPTNSPAVTLSLITAASAPGGFTGPTIATPVAGLITFDSITIDSAASYRYVASAPGLADDTSGVFNVMAGPARSVSFDSQPPTTPRTAQFDLTVSVRDSLGNVAIADSGATATLEIEPGTGNASATLTASPAGFAGGTATFPAISIDSSGSAYRLRVTAMGLSAVSASFDVLADTATGLAFIEQPSSTRSGDTISAVSVGAFTSGGQLDPSYDGVVSLLLITNPGTDSLGGTVSATTVNGVATFTDLTLSSSASGYRLLATSGSLAADSSNLFDIAPTIASAIWKPGVATSWTDSANWAGGSPPGPTDTVWISSRASDSVPVLDANVQLAGLILEPGAHLNTGGFSLTISDRLDAGNTIEGAGSVTLSGPTVTLSGTVNNLVATGGVTLTGDATTTGSLTIDEGGSVDLAGFSFDVQGRLDVITGEPGSGLLVTQPSSALFVGDTARFAGTLSATSTTSGNFTAGTVSFRGDLIQESNAVNSRSFVVVGTDITFDGQTRQTVTFQSPGASGSRIMDVTFSNPSGVELLSDAYIGGALTVSAGSELLQGSTAATYVSTSMPDVSGVYSVSNTHITGNLSISAPSVMTVPGTNLFVDAGASLDVAGNSLELGGDLTVTVGLPGSGLIMRNPADFVSVAGNATFVADNGVGDSETNLTEGVIRIGGDFTQNGTGSGNRSFASTGTRVVLDGSMIQTVRFDSPGVAQSRFAALEIANQAGGVALQSDVFLTDRLVSLLGVTPTVFGSGFSVATRGFDIDGLVFDNAIVASDGGFIRRFDFVTFQNYDPSATQLTVRHPGAAVPVFRGTRFLTTPTTGYYLRAEDTSLDGDTLTINFSESIPDDGSNRTVTVGGAIVNWGVIPWSLVSSGGAFSCGVKQGGAAYCWGNNVSGERGDGTFNTVNIPTAVSGNLNVQRFSIGADHSCAITSDLTSYCWGNNGWGRLGDGTTGRSNVPVPVSTGESFQAVSAGFFSNCAVTTAGLAYCWGRNDHGQLGNGTSAYDSIPVPVSGGIRFQAIATGGLHACGISFSGAAYCWGQNAAGQLGDGTNVESSVPVPVAAGLRFRSITAGDTHTCAISTDGSSYCWGTNWDGRLGDGGNTNRNVPTPVAGGINFEVLSAGGSHTCGVTASAVAYCWGSNGNGQLGDGSTVLRNVPVRVLTGLRFQNLSAGKTPQTCGAAIDGSAHCWGWNFFGQLGNTTNTDSRQPVAVSEP